MYTIDKENLEQIRHAMSTIIEIRTEDNFSELSFDIKPEVQEDWVNSFYYNRFDLRVPIMDLSGDGFPDDGNCVPFYNNTYYNIGLISTETADKNGRFSQPKRIYFPALHLTTQKIPTTLIISDGQKRYKIKVELMQNTPQIIDILPLIPEWNPGKRLIIERILFGPADQFFDDLIGCTVNLRGVETKKNTPALQESEINIEVYYHGSYTDIETIRNTYKTGKTKILYKSGYPGDTSKERTFYLDEDMEILDNILKIHGADATSKLRDFEFNGSFLFVGPTNSATKAYGNMLNKELIRAGITATVEDYDCGNENTTAVPIYLVPGEGKDVIANLVNHSRPILSECGIKYIDAGNPRIIFKDEKEIDAFIQDYADLKMEFTESKVGGACYFGNVSTYSKEIARFEPEEVGEFIEWEDSEFLYPQKVDIQYNGGSYSVIKQTMNKVVLKITKLGTGPLILRGTKVSNLKIYGGYGGNDREKLPDFYGRTADFATFRSSPKSLTDMQNCEEMNYLYTFKWKGDPRLDPGDHIHFTLNNKTETGVHATIDNIELNHSDGGLISTISARGGLF